MIDEAKLKETENDAQPKKPLIRLRVVYQNEDYALNEIRFGQQFNELASYFMSVIWFMSLNRCDIFVNRSRIRRKY